MFVSCGVIKSEDVSNVGGSNNKGSGLTIDNAGIVPILGNNATATSIFIHNNSDQAISDISYDAMNFLQKSSIKSRISGILSDSSGGVIIDEISAQACRFIPAHSRCALRFTTPVLNVVDDQGTSAIVARYSVDGVEKSFSQVINYQRMEEVDGLNITSGVNMSSYGYNDSYGTIYIYSGNQNNKVKGLRLDKPAFSISDNNITGNELSALQVQAVEISAPANITSSMISKLTVVGENKEASVLITALPSNSGAVLVTGLLPNYDLNGKDSLIGNSYIVTNLGNESAVLGFISSNKSALLIASGSNQCQQGMVLSVGASCNIYFNIVPTTESDRLNGSGLINVGYSSSVSGGSLLLINTLNWVNSQTRGLVSIAVSNIINVVQNDGNYGLNESFNMTIKNIGGVNLTNISVSARGVTGKISVESVSNCATLNMGSTCVVNIKVSDTYIEDNKQLLITLTANAGSLNYTRSIFVVYNSITNKALFALQALPNSYQIFGNGKESQTGLIIVSNNGATSTSGGIISSSSFKQFESFFSVDLGTGKCQINQVLNVGESCVVTIKLKPKNQSNINGESGIAVYELGTTGVNLGESTITKVNVSFNVLPNNQGFKIINVSLVNSDSGTGTGESQGSQFILGGEKIASQLVITYQNESTNTLKLLGAYESVTSGVFWRREPITMRDVAPGESFTVIYTNILGSVQANYLSNSLVSPVENVFLPTIYFQDYTGGVSKPTQFKQTILYKGSSYIYIQGMLGTLTNTVTVDNPGLINESYTLATAFNPNGRDYSASTLGVLIYSDITGNTVLNRTTCTVYDTESQKQVSGDSCWLMQSNNWKGSVTYLVLPAYILESDSIFNVYYNSAMIPINTYGRAIVVNKTYFQVTLPKLQ
jgi:hypothetical protein